MWTYTLKKGPSPGTTLPSPLFTVDDISKTLTIDSTDSNDAGTYPVLVTAWNADNPLNTVEHSFNVDV